MSLKTIQQAFLNTVYGNDSTALQKLIQSQPHFTASMRAHVYNNNTHEALKETLRHTYPVCAALVGEAYFSQLATHYVTQHASTTRNLNQYGDTFAPTLTDLVNSQPALQSLNYLPAVAQLEWLLHCSYYAKNRQSFDFNALATLSEQQQASIRFVLADDIQLMDTPFAALAIWQAHQDNNFKFEHSAPQHSFIVVKRDRFLPEAVLVAEDVYRVLVAIQAKKTLLELTVLQEDMRNSSVFSDLITQGWIDAFLTASKV